MATAVGQRSSDSLVPDSASEPWLSVVIGSHASSGALEACLTGLYSQREGTEVVVCEARRSSPSFRRRFAWARFIHRPGLLVPELWREGIDGSRSQVVALTNSTMTPSPDWVATIRAWHERYDAVAGAIEPGSRLRLSDWAEYFCRYAPDMLPFVGHPCPDLPGDNASYKRKLLEQAHDLYRDGFWEPVVHRWLAGEGVLLWHAPDLVVHQERSAGPAAFTRQRLVHGRAHGRQRGAGFGAARNVAGVLAAPLVAPLITSRILRQVSRRRRLRGRAALALPLTFAFNVAWAAGEAAGHLDALRRR